jgi:hypothetical protein
MIEQTLARDAQESRDHAFAVRDLAVIPTELEFGAITVKVLLAQLMEDAVVTAFQQGVERFRRVDVFAVDVDVNLRRVLDDAVTAFKITPDASVRSVVVGDDFCSWIDVDLDVIAKSVLRDVLDMLHSHVAVTLDKNSNRGFGGSTAALVIARSLARLSADVGFIGLHRLAIASQRRLVIGKAHRKADAMSHVPSRFVGDAKFAGNLQRRDAFLAARHQVNRHQPFRERNLAVLEDRADPYRELFPTSLALVDARANGRLRSLFRSQLVNVNARAMRAYRAVRPYLRFDKLTRGGFVREKVAQCRKIQKGVKVRGHCNSPAGSLC